MVAASGLGAEDGAALKKKFKRAVVTGGTYRGARYSDLADADVRKAAKGYRGDLRFLQYCKQFVSLELVDDEPTQQNGAGSRFEKSSDGHVMQQRFLRPFVFVLELLEVLFWRQMVVHGGFLAFLDGGHFKASFWTSFRKAGGNFLQTDFPATCRPDVHRH